MTTRDNKMSGLPCHNPAAGFASHTCNRAWHGFARLGLIIAAVALFAPLPIAHAQQSSHVPGISIRGTITESPPKPQGDSQAAPANTPAPPRQPPASVFPGMTVVTPPPANATAPTASDAPGKLQLSAQLTRDGNRIGAGIVWRIYSVKRGAKPVLVATERVPEPTVTLPAGPYFVIGSLGRAYISAKVEIAAGGTAKSELVLNAGGLKVAASIQGGGKIVRDVVSYDIFSEERDATGERIRVVGGLKPGRIIRLNSGIYQLVSRLGDANATVTSEVTVEAGKLSEVQVIHQAARVTFKLVQRPGGEAFADTQWVVLAGSGGIVKETAGALPALVLAPGTYTVSATSAGRMWQREFAVNSGDSLLVEVIAQ